MDKAYPKKNIPMSQVQSSQPAPMRLDMVQRHLEKVVLSAEMRRSKKLCQFLRFTVEEVLRGHGSELKEYAIGVGVFRRGREFDTGADPIVRAGVFGVDAEYESRACQPRSRGACDRTCSVARGKTCQPRVGKRSGSDRARRSLSSARDH